MLIMNIIRHKVDDETKCPICYDNLKLEQQYTIPDCKHTFHTNCIVHWFRNGYSHCPLCNHCGLGTKKYATNKVISIPNSIKNNKVKFKLIQAYVVKNNKPIWLKKLLDDYNIQLDIIKTKKKKLHIVKHKTGVYKDMYKECKTLEDQINKLEWKLRKSEINILSFPLYPIIMVKYKGSKITNKMRQV